VRAHTHNPHFPTHTRHRCRMHIPRTTKSPAAMLSSPVFGDAASIRSAGSVSGREMPRSWSASDTTLLLDVTHGNTVYLPGERWLLPFLCHSGGEAKQRSESKIKRSRQ
jgi:hypothetical protein